MVKIKANGITLHYEEKGEGTPLILLSGLAQNNLVWKDYMGPLSKDFRVIALDNRGSGQSDSPEEPYSMQLLAEDLIAFMDAIEVKSAHLLGNSMGAAIALTSCVHHPKRVCKVLLCVPFRALNAIARYQMYIVKSLLSQKLPIETIIRTQVPWLYSEEFFADPKRVEKKVAEFQANPHPQTAAGYLGQLSALNHYCLKEELKKIPHKCLIVAGENDLLTPASGAEELCDMILGAEMTILKGQGHALQDEKSKEVIELAKRFFTQD